MSSTDFRISGPDNGVYFASEWVPVATDVYGDPYPGGGYYRSLGSYYSLEAAEAACDAARPKNPVVKTTPLRAYPGFVVRRYADGNLDCAQVGGPAVSQGFRRFGDAVAWARETVFGAQFQKARLCTCPANAGGPEDCLDCALHGADAAEALAAEQQSEIDAENAWLRAAEAPSMDDLAFEAWEASRGLC